MDKIIERILQKNVPRMIGELLVTDENWKLLFRTQELPFHDDQWERWIFLRKDDEISDGSWEVGERESGRYYRVTTSSAEEDGKRFLVHYVYDMSDYAGLFKDLSNYTKEWKSLSSFQHELMSKLSEDCRRCLPVARSCFRTDRVRLYVNRNGKCVCFHSVPGDEGMVRGIPSEQDPLEGKTGEHIDLEEESKDFLCICSGKTASGTTYGLYVELGKDTESEMYPTYFNMFRLYIENSLMREEIRYESEHDALTGLYNKGKYMELAEEEFPFCKSIAIYNLDVNYLKRTNDTLGHEAGNVLLLKASRSIQAVTGSRVGGFGFRTGGDEFLMVAEDIREEDAQKIKEQWEEALRMENEENPSIICQIACGMCYAQAPYDFKAISEHADELMYADKRAIKIANGDDPDAR